MVHYDFDSVYGIFSKSNMLIKKIQGGLIPDFLVTLKYKGYDIASLKIRQIGE